MYFWYSSGTPRDPLFQNTYITLKMETFFNTFGSVSSLRCRFFRISSSKFFYIYRDLEVIPLDNKYI